MILDSPRVKESGLVWSEDFRNRQSVQLNGGTLVGCTVNNSIKTTAASSRVTFAGTENVGINATQMTVVVNFRMGTPAATPWAVLSKCKVPFTDNHWLFLIDTTRQYRFYVCSSGASLADYRTSTDALVIGQEYSVAVVYAGELAAASRLTLYKNGLVDSGANTGTVSARMRSSNVPIVTLNYADYNAQAPATDFLLRSARIYNAAWSAEEVLDDYQNDVYSEVFGGGP